MPLNKETKPNLNGGSLKLRDKFINLGSSVSSTENDLNSRLAKHGQLSIGYEYGNQIYPNCGRVSSTLCVHSTNADKAYRENALQELHKNAIGQILEAISHKTATVRPPTTHLENCPN